MINAENVSTNSIDLTVIQEELRQQEPYAREGLTARTLLRAPDLRIVLVTLKSGARMAKHHANESVSVHVLSGHVRLNFPNRAVELKAGHLLPLERGIEHDVEAQADSSLLLTLGWRA